MPELPEVETIRRGLQRVLPGRTIRRVTVHLPKMVGHDRQSFMRQVQGATIESVQRRAKLVLIALRGGPVIIIHLKMTGQLIWSPARGPLMVGGHPIPGGTEHLPNAYSHVIFELNGGTLFFNDQRQFGYMKLVPAKDLQSWFVDQRYGPEPLDRGFTLTIFEGILGRHEKKRIKPTLMDQTVIAGVGNIYADEACWRAKIRPTRRITSLTARERKDLYVGLLAVLRLSIQHKGTTADAYRMANGRPGGMMPFLNVYQRTGQSCRRCGGTIHKITLAGRGTHYCPDCQR